MVRSGLGAVAGFIAWVVAWTGGELLLSAIWPEAIGVPQRTFQAAIENGGPFTADTTLLLAHCALVPVVSAMAGALSALIAREHRRAPIILGGLLLAVGLAKAVMSWPLVPLWYHVAFTTLLVSMTVYGGTLRAVSEKSRSHGDAASAADADRSRQP